MYTCVYVYAQIYAAMVLSFKPEGLGIGEWLILFSENFEEIERGMGNSEELCAQAQIFGLESLASRRGSLRQKITIF